VRFSYAAFAGAVGFRITPLARKLFDFVCGKAEFLENFVGVVPQLRRALAGTFATPCT